MYSPDIDAIWTGDLILFLKYARSNDGYKYILTVLDTFSKYEWVRLMKDKDKITASNAFEDTIKTSGRQPYKLWTDDGGEFYNHYFRSMLKKHGIELYSTQSELKAIMAERFNQTILNKTSKMFTARSCYRYIDDIDNIMNKYNNTYHSSIKMTRFPLYFCKQKINFIL